MLVEFRLERFKSFREARLPLAELTVLIGANASGKSNLIEALRLLSWLAKGRRLSEVFEALEDKELDIRGGVGRLKHKEHPFCVLGALIREEHEKERFDLELQLQLREEQPFILQETTCLRLNQEHGVEQRLYSIEPTPFSEDPKPIIVIGESKSLDGDGGSMLGTREQAVFTQLTSLLIDDRLRESQKKLRELVVRASKQIQASLESVLFLDPVPQRMRGYSKIRVRSLGGDGAHLSSVLYDLCEKQKRKEEVLAFVRALPEQDISDVGFIETKIGDCMVQLHENFGGHKQACEAALLSDGTLRVLAVAAALLSVPEGTLVVIEEIDNGVHPTRARLLIDNIHRVARERKLRVLLTTHNPALLDALPDEVLPDVVACYRDAKEGDSRLVRLDDLEDYPALVAQGPLGYLSTQGIVERYVRFPKTQEQKEEELRQFLERLRNPEVEP